MTRKDFFNMLTRFGLFALLALIVFGLGNKIVTSRDCSACPGKGICVGETDCNNY